MGKNIFNSIQLQKPKKNVFDLSHDVKLSCNMGELVPVMCTEAVPGDKFNISCESLIRFAPLVSPMMHRCDVYFHYFFVPNRILWDGWEKWIVSDPTAPAFPLVPITGSGTGSTVWGRLADYLGIPDPTTFPTANDININALPFAAYQAIFNEYYRDENLQAEIDYKLINGLNPVTDLKALRNRAWEHDYFTSALPFAQKGTGVSLPVGDVELDPNWASQPEAPRFVDDGNLNLPNADQVEQNFIGDGLIDTINGNPAAYNPGDSLKVSATSINDLRRAFRLQEWLERNARGGTRYVENILAHFGVRSSDKRLQRPEYITGTKSPVQISEVLNTAGGTLPQANMAGHGVSFSNGKNGNYFCEEHGYIIGIMSIMPKTAYQQGIPRHFLKKQDPFQYFWPEFANIGEQEVVNDEVYAYQNVGAAPFGYVPRYAEYKFEQNRVAGDFRSSLDFWHMGRKFATPPALNSAFIECNPTTRVFAVTTPTVQHMYCHVLNKVRAVRPMPKFGTPTI